MAEYTEMKNELLKAQDSDNPYMQWTTLKAWLHYVMKSGGSREVTGPLARNVVGKLEEAYQREREKARCLHLENVRLKEQLALATEVFTKTMNLKTNMTTTEKNNEQV